MGTNLNKTLQAALSGNVQDMSDVLSNAEASSNPAERKQWASAAQQVLQAFPGLSSYKVTAAGLTDPTTGQEIGKANIKDPSFLQSLGKDIGTGMKDLAPLAAFIPGIGPIAAGGLAAGGTFLGNMMQGNSPNIGSDLMAGLEGGAGNAALGGKGLSGLGALFGGGGGGGAGGFPGITTATDTGLGGDVNAIFGPGGVASGEGGGGVGGGGVLSGLEQALGLSGGQGGGVNWSKILGIGAAGAGLAGSIQQRQAAEKAANDMAQMSTQAYNMAGENLQNKMGTFGNQAYANLGAMQANAAKGPTDIFNQSLAKQAGGNAAMTPGASVIPGTGSPAALGFSPQGGTPGMSPQATALQTPASPTPPPTMTPSPMANLGNLATRVQPQVQPNLNRMPQPAAATAGAVM